MISPGVCTLAKYTKWLENKNNANPEAKCPFWLTKFIKDM